MGPTFHKQISTTLGEMTLTRGAAGLTGLYFPNHWHPPTREALGRASNAGFDSAIEQLLEYLEGKRYGFDLDFDVRGTTFELSVWEQIRTIPYGSTATYGELAGRLGAGVSPRIVGGAVGRNPLSIFIPCHRVIGSNGKLTGYAGGLDRKQILLDLESVAGPRPTLF